MKKMALIKKIFVSNICNKIQPYKLTFAATYRCNSRCKICSIWKKHSTNELSSGEIRSIFQSYNNFSWIDLTGGEIYLRKDITEIVKIIVQQCKDLYLLHFPTNGLLTEIIVQKTKEILTLPIRKLIISVSLDGPADTHDLLRGVKTNFERAVQTFSQLRNIQDKRLEVFFGFTLSAYNLNRFETMFRSVKKRFPHLHYFDFHINIAHNSKHYYNNAIPIPPAKTMLAEIQTLLKRKSFSGNPIRCMEKKYLQLADMYILTHKTPVPCKALISSCFIDPHGVVYPCSMMDSKIGNLRENGYDLGKILHSKDTLSVQKRIKTGNCPQCWTPCEAYQSILGSLIHI